MCVQAVDKKRNGKNKRIFVHCLFHPSQFIELLYLSCGVRYLRDVWINSISFPSCCFCFLLCFRLINAHSWQQKCFQHTQLNSHMPSELSIFHFSLLFFALFFFRVVFFGYFWKIILIHFSLVCSSFWGCWNGRRRWRSRKKTTADETLFVRSKLFFFLLFRFVWINTFVFHSQFIFRSIVKRQI